MVTGVTVMMPSGTPNQTSAFVYGVTVAACKVLVKQRLCGSGMRWKERGAATVLSVRRLTYTPERRVQFWARIDRCGFPVAS